MSETKIEIKSNIEWNKSDILRSLKNMADTTKADFEQLHDEPCITDEEAEDLATD